MSTPGIAVPGTVVPSGSLTSPGGAQGVQGTSGDGMAIGTILMYSSTTAPGGWMICDGSAISRTTYPALFSLIGSTFGAGDGSTTFNLPDLRSRVGVGAGQGAGLTNRVLAATGGEESHVLAVGELAVHSHSITDVQHSHLTNQYTSAGAGQYLASAPSATSNGTTQAAYTGITGTNNSGSGTGHNTMPPFVVLAYIIKVSVGGGPTAQAPVADSTQNGLLRQVSGNSTDFVDGTNNCQPLQPVIWSARLRSFNAIGNPTFEIDARRAGTVLTNPSGGFCQDRWQVAKAGTLTVNTQQNAGLVMLPGTTNFAITQNFQRITLTAQELTLGANDYLLLWQTLEGPRLRELIGGVHSLQLLIRSSVAGFQPGIAIRDSTGAHSLSKLFPTGLLANTWTLISFPNLPVWMGGGAWNTTPGNVGYVFYLSLACGSTYLPAANDVWQSTVNNVLGAAGQGNFAASPVNATFDIAFVQHEPGALCTTPIDLSFEDNQHACLRYFDPGTFPYGTAASGGGGTTFLYLYVPASGSPYFPLAFKRKMAKIPTITVFSSTTGAVGTVHDYTSATERTTSSTSAIGDSGFGGWGLSSPPTGAGGYMGFHWIADTGW